MIKNLCSLEHTVGDRVYRLLCDNDSPLNDIKEVLFQFQKYIGQIEDQVKAQQDAAQILDSPVEENKVEELPKE